MREHRWPVQPRPVVEEAVRLFGVLHREGAGKRDERHS